MEQAPPAAQRLDVSPANSIVGLAGIEVQSALLRAPGAYSGPWIDEVAPVSAAHGPAKDRTTRPRGRAVGGVNRWHLMTS